MDAFSACERYKNVEFKSTSYHRSLPAQCRTQQHTTMEEINMITSCKTNCISFLMNHGVIHDHYICPNHDCGAQMKLVLAASGHKSSDGLVWKCRRMSKGKRHKIERSIRKGSWLSSCNLTLEEIIKCIYYWTRDLQQKQVRLLYLP